MNNISIWLPNNTPPDNLSPVQCKIEADEQPGSGQCEEQPMDVKPIVTPPASQRIVTLKSESEGLHFFPQCKIERDEQLGQGDEQTVIVKPRSPTPPASQGVIMLRRHLNDAETERRQNRNPNKEKSLTVLANVRDFHKRATDELFSASAATLNGSGTEDDYKEALDDFNFSATMFDTLRKLLIGLAKAKDLAKKVAVKLSSASVPALDKTVNEDYYKKLLEEANKATTVVENIKKSIDGLVQSIPYTLYGSGQGRSGRGGKRHGRRGRCGGRGGRGGRGGWHDCSSRDDGLGIIRGSGRVGSGRGRHRNFFSFLDR